MVDLDPIALGKKSKKLTDKLSNFQKQLTKLNIPKISYMGIHINDDNSFEIAELIGHRFKFYNVNTPSKNINELITWLENHMSQHNTKVMAVGLGGRHKKDTFVTKLWLGLDIVPHFISQDTHRSKEDLMQTAKITQSLFKPDLSAKVFMNKYNQINSSHLIQLVDYKQTVSNETWEQLQKLKEVLKNKQILFFSATPQGGGVSIMRHALVRLSRLLGTQINWHVLRENPKIFSITKTKFHNVLQDVASDNANLTQPDKDLFATWSEENARLFRLAIEKADIIIIDDPQPSGMIKFIKQWHPQAKLLYRSHIQIESNLVDKPKTLQNDVWTFLWQNIKECQLFIAHPIKKFIPQVIPNNKVVLMPPVLDNFDGLNKPLSPTQNQFYLKLVNKYLLETHQEILDDSRPYIAQIARFDPSKGIPDVIDAYIKLCKKLDKKVRPQLIIAGHGSIDDPDGAPIFNMLQEQLKEPHYQEFANDIKLARLPHIDQALNVITKNAKVILQLSHKEGFEFNVSQALKAGKPVIAYRAGGIPLQIDDGKTGFLVDIGDTEQVAEYLYRLFSDNQLYAEMSKSASNTDYTWVTTVQNAINWFYIFKQVLDNNLPGNFAHIPTLANPDLWYPVPKRMGEK